MVQRSTAHQNNPLLPRERMKVLPIACGLRSMMYYDLIIKAEDGSQPSSREQYMEAARAQKLGMGVYLAEWDLTRVKWSFRNDWLPAKV
jgi:hypothetical protein